VDKHVNLKHTTLRWSELIAYFNGALVMILHSAV